MPMARGQHVSVLTGVELLNILTNGDDDDLDRFLENLGSQQYQALEHAVSKLEAAFRRRYASMDVTQRERDHAK